MGERQRVRVRVRAREGVHRSYVCSVEVSSLDGSGVRMRMVAHLV